MALPSTQDDNKGGNDGLQRYPFSGSVIFAAREPDEGGGIGDGIHDGEECEER